jgi:dGTP triphosphohydrolase
MYVIDQPSLASQQIAQGRMIRELLGTYHSEADRLLSEGWRHSLDKPDSRLRAATDFLACLTERHAQALYHRLMGIPISVVETPRRWCGS